MRRRSRPWALFFALWTPWRHWSDLLNSCSVRSCSEKVEKTSCDIAANSIFDNPFGKYGACDSFLVFSFCVFFLARGSTPVKTDGSEWFYVSKRFLTESVILRGTQYLTTLSANMAELARRHIFEIVYFFTNYVVLLSASPAWVSPGACGSPGPLNSLILPSP